MSNLDDKFQEVKEDVKDGAERVASDAKEAGEKAKDNFEEKKDELKTGVDKTVSEIKEGANQVKEEVKEAGESAKDKFQDAKEHLKTGVNQTVEDVKSVSTDDNNKAVIMHILSIFFGFISPLVFYFALSDSSGFVKEESKRDLNFQITIVIGYVVGMIVPFIGWFIILPLVAIASLVFEILALLKAKYGEHYKFPFTLNLIK